MLFCTSFQLLQTKLELVSEGSLDSLLDPAKNDESRGCFFSCFSQGKGGTA